MKGHPLGRIQKAEYSWAGQRKQGWEFLFGGIALTKASGKVRVTQGAVKRLAHSSRRVGNKIV